MQKLHPERDAELYKAFKRAFASPHTHSFQQAIRLAINSPCSQFYVSAEEAYRFISMKNKYKGKRITRWRYANSPISKLRLQALQTIYKRYLRLRETEEFRDCTTLFISTIACYSQAPCFFISYRRAYEIIRQMRKHGHVLSRTHRP